MTRLATRVAQCDDRARHLEIGQRPRRQLAAPGLFAHGRFGQDRQAESGKHHRLDDFRAVVFKHDAQVEFVLAQRAVEQPPCHGRRRQHDEILMQIAGDRA